MKTNYKGQKKSSILNFYKPQTIFINSQNKNKSSTLLSSLKKSETIDQYTLDSSKQLFLPREQLLNNNYRKSQLSNFQRQNFIAKSFEATPKYSPNKHIKTSKKVQQCSTSPLKQFQKLNEQKIINSNFGSKSQIHLNNKVNESIKISQSQVKQYNQKNIYSLLKKIKNHKQQMNRQMYMEKQKQTFKDNYNYQNKLNCNTERQINQSHLFQKNRIYNAKQQIQQIQRRLTSKSKNIFESSKIKPLDLFQYQEIQYQGISQQTPINKVFITKNQKINNFTFYKSQIQLENYLTQYIQSSRQSVLTIQNQIQREKQLIDLKIQQFASKFKQIMAQKVSQFIEKWKISQRQDAENIINTNFVQLSELKDQLSQRALFLQQSLAKLQLTNLNSNLKNKQMQVNIKKFTNKQIQKQKGIGQTYKEIFSNTIGSQIDKYIDQLQFKVKQDIIKLKKDDQFTNHEIILLLRRSIQQQTQAFNIFSQRYDKKNFCYNKQNQLIGQDSNFKQKESLNFNLKQFKNQSMNINRKQTSYLMVNEDAKSG